MCIYVNFTSVYGWQPATTNDEGDEIPGYVYPLYVPKVIRERHADTLLITQDEISHYCWIKDFNKMMGSDGTARKSFCRYIQIIFY